MDNEDIELKALRILEAETFSKISNSCLGFRYKQNPIFFNDRVSKETELKIRMDDMVERLVK